MEEIPQTEDKHIIQLFHVYKRYGAKNALFDLNLEIFENEMVIFTGPSGAGKTTLLKLIYLGEPVSEGQIIINGKNIARVTRREVPFFRRKLGIIFQDFKLIPTKTVFDNIALVLEVAGNKPAYIQKKVNSILRTVSMDGRQNALPPSLSGGEQQRIAIARAVVGEPDIILADEPTGSLDPASADIITALLKKFHKQGATVIIATHDRELIRSTNGRVVELKEGHIQKPSAICL